MKEKIKEHIEKYSNRMKNNLTKIIAIVLMLVTYAFMAFYTPGIVIMMIIPAGLWKIAELMDDISNYLNDLDFDEEEGSDEN